MVDLGCRKGIVVGLRLIMAWAVWPDLGSFSICNFYLIAGGVNLNVCSPLIDCVEDKLVLSVSFVCLLGIEIAIY